MKSFVRDSTVQFKFRFHDALGEIRNPSAAFMTICFVPVGDYSDPTLETVTLSQQGNDWLYEWYSGVAKPCVVTAHAETLGTPTCAVDVQFRLTANRANHEMSGEL